jgi:hypothetical protein
MFNPKKFDKFTLDYIFKEISRMEMKNYERWENKDDFAKGKNYAYRECIRLLTSILNNKNLYQ